MNQLSKALFSIVCAVFLFSCGGGKQSQKEGSDTDYRTEIRLKQYRVKGAQLYATYCANCHQQNGEGLAQLYPPLSKSDFLLNDLKRAACIIKNGQSGVITVNGKVYNQAMPANENLTSLEVAEILTFITNAWENQTGLTGVKTVEKWLQDCE